MIRKLILLCAALTLVMPTINVEAAQKKTKRVTASSKHKVSSRKIIRTIRADRKYQMQNVNYNRSSVFKDSYNGTGILTLASSKALIVNQETGEVLYSKSTDLPTPIASVTKLMTAMVMLDAHLPMDEYLSITEADIDMLKGTGSRLRLGTQLTRAELLQLALMASENRAASALGRNYPGGLIAFVAAMNFKAAELGMTHTRFVDPTGLNSANVATAQDLVKMVRAAYQYPEIRQVSTTASHEVPVYGYRNPVNFVNTNVLVRNSDWIIGLSKTGYINEAGRCLVMQAEIAGQPLIIVLLDSWGKYSRIGDAQRIRKWIESSNLLRNLG
ncbi:MAG TPA: D-alanyl-D-alanine endopeptidase [Methylophilaceae bacterium]|nr:D-alanyl-D-alanine endopeptidase [Methylophilaceae bacterium]